MDMYAHMCQPKDVVVVTASAAPSQDQILALLAAPAEGEYPPPMAAGGSCGGVLTIGGGGSSSNRGPQYTEVNLFCAKGPHPVADRRLAQHLQLLGVPSSLADRSMVDITYARCIKEDTEAFLMHLIMAARSRSDLGRVVLVLCTSAVQPHEVGLIIAASARSKAVSEEAVMWLLGQLEPVLDLA